MLTRRQLINIFHILIVSSFLWFLAWKKSKSPKGLLTLVAVVIIIFHSYRLITKLRSGMSLGYSTGVNIFHIIVVAGLFLYLGRNTVSDDSLIWKLFAVLPLFIIPFHSYIFKYH